MENQEELDDTVRVLASSFVDPTSPTAEDTRTTEDKEDILYVIILRYGGLLDFEADNFCFKRCFKPLTQTRLDLQLL